MTFRILVRIVTAWVLSSYEANVAIGCLLCSRNAILKMAHMMCSSLVTRMSLCYLYWVVLVYSLLQ